MKYNSKTGVNHGPLKNRDLNNLKLMESLKIQETEKKIPYKENYADVNYIIGKLYLKQVQLNDDEVKRLKLKILREIRTELDEVNPNLKLSVHTSNAYVYMV